MVIAEQLEGYNVTQVGYCAFRDTKINTVVIPATVTRLEKGAFDGCSNLSLVIFKGDVPELYYGTCFSGVGTSEQPSTLCVPLAYLANYESTFSDGKFDGGYFTLVTSTENLKVAAAGYATYYNSKADATLPDDMIAYTVSGLRTETQPEYQIVSGNVVPAGMAVLLYSAEAEQEAVGKNYTLALDYTVTPDATANDGNWLHGSDVDATTATEGTAKYYKLSYSKTDETQFGWHYGATDGAAFDIEAHRAWLAIPEGNNARELVLPNEKNTTGIQQMTANERQSDAIYYDLQGRAVKKPVRGMYIISSSNGRMSGKNVKKMMVK